MKYIEARKRLLWEDLSVLSLLAALFDEQGEFWHVALVKGEEKQNDF